MSEAPRVDGARLWESLQQYGQIGATPDGGVTRPIFSVAEREARALLIADCRALGLRVRVDAAANVVASRPGAEPALPAILIGSHLDSVLDGGRYDGAFGVLCALEALRTLLQHDITTRHTVRLISFTGEEATPYGTSTFGSRAVTARLTNVAANRLPDGRTVRDALAACGGNWDRIAAAPGELGPVACFLEAHIEQGRRLEEAGQALAVVSAVCGIYRQRVEFVGEAGHAGTVAMGERRDALRAAARFVLAVAALPDTVAAADPAATATVGFLEVAPNSPNVIPGMVTAVTDLRAGDPTILTALVAAVAEAAEDAGAREGVRVSVGTVLDQAPVVFDARLRSALAVAVREVGGDGRELPSGAGHDAVHLSAVSPAGMLFVRCAGGVSHNSGESMTPEDAALAADALLRAVLALDR